MFHETTENVRQPTSITQYPPFSTYAFPFPSVYHNNASIYEHASTSLLTFYYQPPPPCHFVRTWLGTQVLLGYYALHPRLSLELAKPHVNYIINALKAVIYGRETSQHMPEVDTSQAVLGRMLPILHATRFCLHGYEVAAVGQCSTPIDEKIATHRVS